MSRTKKRRRAQHCCAHTTVQGSRDMGSLTIGSHDDSGKDASSYCPSVQWTIPFFTVHAGLGPPAVVLLVCLPRGGNAGPHRVRKSGETRFPTPDLPTSRHIMKMKRNTHRTRNRGTDACGAMARWAACGGFLSPLSSVSDTAGAGLCCCIVEEGRRTVD